MRSIICFACRRSDCRCQRAQPPLGPTLGQALAWLGGACMAGSAVGALMALLLG